MQTHPGLSVACGLIAVLPNGSPQLGRCIGKRLYTLIVVYKFLRFFPLFSGANADVQKIFKFFGPKKRKFAFYGV
jgi:hypothetical protein